MTGRGAVGCPFITFIKKEVPAKYWIDDSNFEEIIHATDAFDDDEQETLLIEFWAEFNEQNCFAEWEEIEGAKYYRVDISKAPNAKKKYKVRMAPTLIIFKGGVKEKVFKAGLDLVLPADLKEIQESINEVNTASKF